jgi:hypothetical protein
VVTDDLAAADDGWRGIEATFAHQREDGGFEANDRPNGASAKPFGASSSASLRMKPISRRASPNSNRRFVLPCRSFFRDTIRSSPKVHTR